MIRFFAVCVAICAGIGGMVQAQSSGEVVWVQIEAQPNLDDGLARAQDYARRLDDVNGFALGGGWYGILLGPYAAEDAQQVLQIYRADGLIPRDSYIAFSSVLGRQFFPPQTDVFQSDAAVTEPQPVPDTPAEAPTPVVRGTPDAAATTRDTVPDETPAQARQSERALSPAERRAVQTALQWAGFYNATIDGAFGRGTRSSMSAWQTANGFEVTGVLTSQQRATLLRQYNAILDGLGVQTVSDTQTGIDIKLPTARVTFDRYDPPFARFEGSGDDAAQVLLISQPGDVNTLSSLYQIMQTLEIVPLDGPRALERTRFTLTGRTADIVSDTRVWLESGEIKGFTLVWPAGDEDRRTRLLAEMEASFTRMPGVLDPAAGGATDQQIDLIGGLRVRTPRLSRSGFFVDDNGTLITTADAVQRCTRITVDEDVEARLSTLDAELGVAVLTPERALAPQQVAAFGQVPPRLQSDVAVSGYSYEGILDAPSVTFGTLSDLRGLSGEQDLSRLSLQSLPGDAGGPVFDASGNVHGMLLPRVPGARQLPQDVRFALTAPAIAGVLEAAGVSASSGTNTTALAPEDITARAVGMTVLVSCWE